MNDRKQDLCAFLALVLFLLPAITWISGCLLEGDPVPINRRVVGVMEVDPPLIPASGSLEIEVSIWVFEKDSNMAKPVPGVQIEIFSSRNQGGNVIDFIEQPRAPTDSDGRATAFLGSSTPGEARLRATVNGAPLCETWNDGECVPLEIVIVLYEDCEGADLTDCDGECVDLNTDPDHCGNCNNACELENASSGCVDGICVVYECDTNWGNCDDDDSNGCESNLQNDQDNCGTCGDVCTPPDVCSSFSCVDFECDPGAPELCDGKDNDCDGETDEDPNACDDANECTDDLCERGIGCVNILMVGIACDDNDYCTENDACNDQGVCAGNMIDEDGDGHSPLPCGDDCDDTDPDVNPFIFEGGPGHPDRCTDSKDNDCDGLTDNQDPGCCACASDDYCQDGDPCNGMEWCDVPTCRCMLGTPVDCDDDNDCTIDICVSSDGSCSHTPLDSDDDGYVAEQCGGGDCDDGDPAINPGVTEGPQGSPTCSDGVDNDCDTDTDDSDSGCIP